MKAAGTGTGLARLARDVTVPDGADGRRQRIVVLLICSSSLYVVYLDSTVLNVALPTLQRDLHASLSGLQWVADAYLLVVASLLMLTGSAADRLGRRRLFLIGLAGFGLGSLAIGVWSGIFGVATACGPVVGGILVSTSGWRSIFWLNVPICAAMIAAALRYVPESKAPRPRRADIPGQLLMIALLGSLTYAVIQGPDSGWTAPPVLALFAAAAAAAAAFVAVERSRREPLVELRFFRSPPYTGAGVIALAAFTVLGGFLFVITLYLQQVRGDSPLRAGLSLLPATLVMAAAAPVAGQLTGHRGPRIPLVASGLCTAAGMALLLSLSPGTSYLYLAVALAVLGAGLGLVNPPITAAAVSGMPAAQAGVASAVISSTRQVGSVTGVAVMGDLVTTGVRRGTAAGQSHAAALSAATHAPWAVGVACGLVVAVAGYVTTTARAQATARAVTAEPAPHPGGRAA